PPISPPPFATVDYAFDFNADFPIDAAPPLTINPVTGVLTATPNFFGQYVVGVCVKEYRDGVLINTHLRDFQFNITDCTPPLYASFPDEYNNCDDMTIYFDNNSFGTSTFYWDFGVSGLSSDFSTAFEPTYTYPDTGTYIVMLIANPGTDCADTSYSEVQIYPHLIASFNYESACAHQPLLFDDGSVTTYGELVQWQWNFGFGSTSPEQDPEYTFETGGSFPVTLKVKNDVGCEEEITNMVTVYPLPQADFDWTSHCLGQEIALYDLSTIDSAYSVTDGIWILPDSTAFGTDTHIAFTHPGLYNITYIAVSDKGCTDTITHYLSVAPEIVAEIPPDTSVCIGDSVQLLVRNGSYYQWTPVYHISDANAFNPYVFPEVSTVYTVVVSDGCTYDTASIYVEALERPAVFAWPDTAV
ncbi:MAG: PKD domain-containing protein, partial [Chitinophagales bacterium]